MGEVEDRLAEEEKVRIEKDREKWIVNRKRQRAHFRLLKERMIRLNRDPNIDTAEEIWKDNIEPKIQGEK